jgi:hypothetical protein
MSTPGFSIPNAAAATLHVHSIGGGGGDTGRSGADLTRSEALMLRGVYEWVMAQKRSAVFSPLTLTGTKDGVFGIWVWNNQRGVSIKLTTPMGYRSSLITCYRSEADEVFSGVWNRVLGGWNDVTFNKPVTRNWLFAEFGIAVSKSSLQEKLQGLRVALKFLRRRVRAMASNCIGFHR